MKTDESSTHFHTYGSPAAWEPARLACCRLARCRLALWRAVCVLAWLCAMGPPNLAAAAPFIGFSSKTASFGAVNPRTAGTSETALIVFNLGEGSTDPAVPIQVLSSDTSRLVVTPLAVPTALGTHLLAVPLLAAAGQVTVTATATVGGVDYLRSRLFAITAAAPPPPPPPPAPAAPPTLVRATTPTLNADQSGCAAIQFYDVGPGRAFSALSQLPWSQLKGCDTVRIYPKLNNAPYQEMMLISAGTNLAPTAPNRFMRVLGMPDPVSGARPIIDGTQATQLETPAGQAPRSLQYHDNGGGNRQLFRLGLVMVGPQSGYSYNFGPTGYIAIENLEIRNAAYGAGFTDGKTGLADAYGSFGSCLYVEASAHIVIKNNLLHDCGNGLFMNSKNGALVELSQDVLIEGNQFFNNSNPPIASVTNGYSEHHSYTEARDIIFQYNHFGDVRPGAMGDCLKDRSSGLVVRFNTFASNCGIHLNLMDSTGGQSLIHHDPGYAQTFVYGNLIDEAPAVAHATTLVFYGGDSGTTANYRQGTLHFYNNTLVLTGDAGHGIYPETFLFNMAMPSALADVRNNVLQATPVTPGTPGKIAVMALGQGTVNLGNNWVSPNAAAFWIGHVTGTKLNGWASNLGAGNQPLFANAALHDWLPGAGSPLVNAGDNLGDLPAWALPTSQPGAVRLRKQDGALDIGAFER